MVKLLRTIQRLFYSNHHKNILRGQKIVATNLRSMLGVCPACSQELVGHVFARFAITVFSKGSENRVNDFLAAIKEHRWNDVIMFREFDGLSDALVAYALSCPSKQIVWLVIREPYNLGDNPNIIDQEILDAKSSLELESQISQSQWVSLTT